MRKIKKYKAIISMFIALPILVSLDPLVSDSHYLAKFQSPEGITFLSYSHNWGTNDLEELYNELIKNKHGDEIELLQEVKVVGNSSSPKNNMKGQYHALTNTITLYQGDRYTTPEQYRDTLSHEYGHHFAYYYFPTHHFPFSKWSQLRGLENQPIQWNTFFNYDLTAHEWFPQEIFADDYVLLFGNTKELSQDMVTTNEAFYIRTEHENQSISNVLENKELIEYIETITGSTVDKDRIIHTPTIAKIEDSKITVQIDEKPNVAYRLNLVYNDETGRHTYEVHQISSTTTEPQLTFMIEDTEVQSLDHLLRVSIDVVDLNTSIGFRSSEITVTQ